MKNAGQEKMSVRSYIVDDHEQKTFLLDREVLVWEEILRRERAHIFGRCWIFVGHASELNKAGDFRSRSRRPARWRSSPACRNTTSPPTGS